MRVMIEDSRTLRWWRPRLVQRSPLSGYVTAIAFTAAALGIRLWLDPVLADRIPFASFFAAVALTAWFGGFGPCLVAIVLGALAVWYFVLEPRHSFALDSPYQTLGLITFALTGLVIAGFSSRTRSALRAMHDAQREAERRARDAVQGQQILTTLLANVPEGITMAGGPPDFPIIAQSKFAEESIGPAARNILGVSAGEHIFRSGILRPDGVTTPAREEVPLYRATRFGEVVKNEPWVLRRYDGKPIHVLVNTVPIRDASGSIIGGIGCWRDVTEQRALMDALADSEERFRATFEQAAVGIGHVSLEGKWLRVNERLCRMTGYSREEMLERGFQDITYPGDPDRDLVHMASLLAGEIQSYSLEKRYVHRDRTLFWVTITVALMRKHGKPQYFISVIEDISKRKAVEAEIRQLNEELESRVEARTAELTAANRELEAFSYSVSHDLRAPLRSIEGFSQIVLEDYGDRIPPEARAYLARVCASTKNMGQLIDDLLEFSRLGRKELITQSVDLRQIAERCIAELREAHPDRAIDVVVGDLPRWKCDPALMRQVFANLLSNAVKFTRNGRDPQVSVGTLTQNNETVVYVRDNGAGFDMRYAKKIFGVFERLHRAEDYEGTGVGLAIVKRIIERHAGRVWAESQPGQGATFYFTLPAPGGELHS
jgi:PAS domain S-box-containing protein